MGLMEGAVVSESYPTGRRLADLGKACSVFGWLRVGGCAIQDNQMVVNRAQAVFRFQIMQMGNGNLRH